jgi:hypothetical protein
MTLSEKYSGLGTDSLSTAMVVEELARGDLGISVVMAQTLKLAQIMEKELNLETLACDLRQRSESRSGNRYYRAGQRIELFPALSDLDANHR